MEIESEVDVIATTSFHQTFVHHHLPLRKNRVLISFYKRFQRFEIDDSNGTLTCIGRDPPTRLPARHINLNLFSHELSPNYLSSLIESRLQDRTLSRSIAEKIAAEAIQYVELLQPYVMSVCVFKTQKVVSGEEEGETQKEEDKEDEEESTCAICLEGLCNKDEIFDLLFCSHRFHDRCIGEWLQRNKILALSAVKSCSRSRLKLIFTRVF